MDRNPSPTRRRVAAAIGALTIGALTVAAFVAPAGAASGQPGTKVAAVIAAQWWPSARKPLVAQIPATKRLNLTKVKCPRGVPQSVADPEGAISDALADFAAGDVAPALTRSGVFSCTATLDGQTLLVVGAISPKGDAHFATASLILSPDALASQVADAYAARTGSTAEARCPGNTVLVVQPDTPFGCQTRDTATRAISDVAVTVDGDLNATYAFSQ